MPVTNDALIADVAAVHAGGAGAGSFGAGRLIAPDLVLTAGHVVDFPSRDRAWRVGWKVHLGQDRGAEGSWGPAREAELVWRGAAGLDLALLRLTGKPGQPPCRPALQPVFACIRWTDAIAGVHVAGFPCAWDLDGNARDFKVPGILWEPTAGSSYGWQVPPGVNPDVPEGWKGMSGAGACFAGKDGALYLFGAIEEVPACFRSMLTVAPLASAFADGAFREELEAALPGAAQIFPFQEWQTSRELGIARLFQKITKQFEDYYLLSETGPDPPFGGRDAELRYLNAWLLDPARAPRLLVTAPAGRGKSALLVQWIRALEKGKVCGPDGWQLVFVPISIRAGSNLPQRFYEGLAQRLAEIRGLPFMDEPGSDAERYKWRAHELLGAIGDKRVLIVIDGIDEALRGSFDDGFLPRPLPPNVKVVFSARWLLGDCDSQGWLGRLNWEQGVRVDTYELERLDRAGIADVFVKLGAPANTIAHDTALVERLRYLTKGEPLLVNYYAVDLWPRFEEGRARITLADLDSLKPGFGNYFKRWFEYHQKLRMQEGRPSDAEATDQVLSVLAFALGPLEATDLAALMQRIHGVTGILAIDSLLEPLDRFVIGNGKKEAGYILSHPMIASYLQRERFRVGAMKLHQGFADWGLAHLADLRTGRVAPQAASAYALQFLPEHLTETSADADTFMLMVEDQWRQAWEHLEGGAGGFAGTVKAAWAVQPRSGAALGLGKHWRCALALASIHMLNYKIPDELLLAAVRAGELPLAQAVHIAHASRRRDARLFTELAVLARDHPKLSAELALEAFECQEPHVGYVYPYGGNFLPRLLDEAEGPVAEARQAVLDVAIRPLMENEVSPFDHVWVSGVKLLAPYLTQEQADQAFERARRLAMPDAQADALVALLPRIGPGLRTAGLRAALRAAKRMKTHEARCAVLVRIAQLDPTKRSSVPNDVVRLARRMLVLGEFHPEMFTWLEPRLPRALWPTMREDAIAAANALAPGEDERLDNLAKLAPWLTREELDKACADARLIKSGGHRSAVLQRLGRQLPGASREAVLDEALRAALFPLMDGTSYILAELAPDLSQQQCLRACMHALEIDTLSDRARAVAALVPYLPEPAGSDALEQTFQEVKAIDDSDPQRTPALSALAPHLSRQQLAEALEIARIIGDDVQHGALINALAPYLEQSLRPDLWEKAFELASKVGTGADAIRAMTLATLVRHLPPAQQTAALDGAFTAAGHIHSPAEFARAWETLSLNWPGERLSEALATAGELADSSQCSIALAQLVPHVGRAMRTSVVNAALKAAMEAIAGDHGAWSAYALICLGPLLSPRQRDRALAAVRESADDEHELAVALAALAPDFSAKGCHEAVATAVAIDDEGCRLLALGSLAPRLQAGQWKVELARMADPVSRALLAMLAPDGTPGKAHAILRCVAPPTYEKYHAELLAMLGKRGRLPLQHLDRALRVAGRMETGAVRAKTLAVLVPYLAPAQLAEALMLAEWIRLPADRVPALEAIAARRFERQADALLALIDFVASMARPWVASVIIHAVQPTCELGGEAAIHELWRAIEDIYCWYP